MSEHHHEPLQDLENFNTAGIALAPLPPSEVRRLGDRRRAHRRNAAVIAAAVIALLAVAVPVTLTRGGGDSDGTGFVDRTPSPTPTSAVITYPGVGVELSTPADVDQLTGTPQAFRDFIADQVRRANDGSSCPGASVTVRKYSSAGYAEGAVGSCGGYVALWVLRDGHWQEGMGTQDTWDCTTLGYLGVPTSFAGECFDYAGDFGPDEVSGLRLGMTQAQVEAAGGSLDPGPADRCRGLLLPHQSRVPDQVDGWFSPARNLVAISARPGMKTPEKVGLGSSRAAVEAAYPGGSLQNGYWVVPLRGGTEYQIGIEQDGTVGELLLADTDQDCFG